ncbi:hypothetical protein [Alloactinosynnema sp. L-07]|nr:hypothetical protein [Alloactinosynnema sp. L-07]
MNSPCGPVESAAEAQRNRRGRRLPDTTNVPDISLPCAPASTTAMVWL